MLRLFGARSFVGHNQSRHTSNDGKHQTTTSSRSIGSTLLQRLPRILRTSCCFMGSKELSDLTTHRACLAKWKEEDGARISSSGVHAEVSPIAHGDSIIQARPTILRSRLAESRWNAQAHRSPLLEYHLAEMCCSNTWVSNARLHARRYSQQPQYQFRLISDVDRIASIADFQGSTRSSSSKHSSERRSKNIRDILIFRIPRTSTQSRACVDSMTRLRRQFMGSMTR